jgi:beta-phosphoglucomutase
LKSFVFDLDGVIVDTRPYHFLAWRRLAEQLGFALSEAHNEELRGLSRMGSLEKILDWGGIYMTEAEKLHWADVKNNWYVNLISQMRPDEVLPGVEQVLKTLKYSGCPLGLVSSSRNARAVLQSTQLEHYFNVVIDGNTIKKPKPFPDAFLMAAYGLDMPPQQCVAFDDAPVGIQAARMGRLTTVAVGEHAALCQADHSIAGFDDSTIWLLLDQWGIAATQRNVAEVIG